MNPAKSDTCVETCAIDNRSRNAAETFVGEHPDYVPEAENYAATVSWLLQHKLNKRVEIQDLLDDEELLESKVQELTVAGCFTPEDLGEAWVALKRAGLAILLAGQPRELTEGERNIVEREAVVSPIMAIALALAYSTDHNVDFRYDAQRAEQFLQTMIDNPKQRALVDRYVFEVWRIFQTAYVATAERDQWILNYCGNRPLSLALLDTALRALLQAEKQSAESAAANRPPSQQELDDLSDTQVDQLYHQTQRTRARGIAEANRQGRQPTNAAEHMAQLRSDFEKG